MTIEEMKTILDRRLPGFTQACDKVAASDGEAVFIRRSDFNKHNQRDRNLIGVAMLYATDMNVLCYMSNLPKTAITGAGTALDSTGKHFTFN